MAASHGVIWELECSFYFAVQGLQPASWKGSEGAVEEGFLEQRSVFGNQHAIILLDLQVLLPQMPLYLQIALATVNREDPPESLYVFLGKLLGIVCCFQRIGNLLECIRL